MKKPVKIIIFVALALLILVGGYYLFNPSATIESSVAEPTFARSIETKTAQPQDKTDIFYPDEDVFLSFKVDNSFRKLTIRVEWYSLDSTKKISENQTEVFGSRQLSFVAKAPATGWPVGSYQAKISVNQQEKTSLNFTVVDR
jgi:hypothetical protein